jgi:uncharacterized small protein (DUF1192 family)
MDANRLHKMSGADLARADRLVTTSIRLLLARQALLRSEMSRRTGQNQRKPAPRAGWQLSAGAAPI